MPNVKKRLSWHLADLLGRDVSVCHDVVKWLAVTPSEVAQRKVNKRLMARYAAAKMILAAVEDGNSGLFTHILDRTEGKVVERIEHLDINRMVDQLEAARSRVLQSRAHDNRLTDGQQVIDGVDVKAHTLDTGSSGRPALTAAPVGTGETSPGPITGVESHVVSPPTRETGKLE